MQSGSGFPRIQPTIRNARQSSPVQSSPMPLHAEDLSTIMAPNGQPADIISHNTKYVSLENMETTRSLKVISTRFGGWSREERD